MIIHLMESGFASIIPYPNASVKYPIYSILLLCFPGNWRSYMPLGCHCTRDVRGSQAVRGCLTDSSQRCAGRLWCDGVSGDDVSVIVNFKLSSYVIRHMCNVIYDCETENTHLSLFFMNKYLAPKTLFHRSCAKRG